MVIILGMMQVSKKIPFDDPNVLMGVRAMYIISNLIILGIYLYMQQKINAKKGGHFPVPSFKQTLSLTAQTLLRSNILSHRQWAAPRSLS